MVAHAAAADYPSCQCSAERIVSKEQPKPPASPAPENPAAEPAQDQDQPREIGGRKGLEPTRYGDWEKNGRCIDF